MKKQFKKVLMVVLAISGFAVMSGCNVTPSAHLGVGLDFSGGDVRLRPHASIGVTGRP